jgi:hypothetical protein
VKGKNNIVVDSLSRKLAVCSLMEISFDWKSHLLVEYSKNQLVSELIYGLIHDDRYRVVADTIF